MEEQVYLSKRLGAFEVFTISSGTMIGAGIFVLPGILVSKAGAASILCFLVAGIISGCAALSVCELATAMPKAGGSYYFISRSMGALFGSIIGWGSLLGLVFKGAFAFIGAGEYLKLLLDIGPVVTAIALCAVIMSVNVFGTNAASKVQNLIVVFMLAIFAMFIGQGLFMVQARYFSPFFSNGAASFFEATGMVFITYLGLINVSAVSEEVKTPSRDLPLGILSSVFFVTVLYAFVMAITVGVLPVWELLGSLTPVAEAARKMIGGGGLVIMVSCGMLATLSTGNAALMSSSRYPFAMARDNLMPRWLAKIDELLRTPARSIFLVGASMVALIVFVDLENIVKLGSAFNMIVFALLSISVVIMRTAEPSWYKPGFRSPLYPWVQVVGTVGSLALIPFMGIAATVGAAVLVLAGAAWYYLYGRGKAEPAYRLRDTLRVSSERRRERAALETHDSAATRSWRLLVPLWFSQVPAELIRISGYLAEHFEEKAHIVHCTEVTEQTPVSIEAASEIPDGFDPGGVLLTLDEEMRTNFDLTDLYACSRETGFIEMANDYGCDLALMEWPEQGAASSWELNRVVRDMPCDLAFLVSRPMPDIRKILVATGLFEDRLKMTIAAALAAGTGAEVTLQVVYPEGTREVSVGDLKRRSLQAGTLYGVPLHPRVDLAEDVARAVIAESVRHDILIVGSAPDPRWSRTPFGPLVEEVVEGAGCPVLVTVPRSPAKRRLYRRVLRRLLGMP
jgi:amino acid transporter/nucleotide-binding universal stress UspA family protein